MLEVFVARQPIVDHSKEVFAYELFYRNGMDNYFPQVDGDVATLNVIIHSFLDIGIDNVTNGKPYFINFTEHLLQLEIPTLFNPNHIVVEITESIYPSVKNIESCRRLKEMGYRLALDDFSLLSKSFHNNELLDLVDYIKVDFLSTTKGERRLIEEKVKKQNIMLIAEKIETSEAYEEALQHGYSYFQGYYFAGPTTISTITIPLFFKVQDISIYELDLEDAIELVQRDLSLFLKLLKATEENSKICSIHHLVNKIGIFEVRKWLFMLSLQEKNRSKLEIPKELIEQSLTRAKMCQSIAALMDKQLTESTYFTLGLLSLMDKITNFSYENVVKNFPLHEEIAGALEGSQNNLREVLDLVLAMEKADWQTIREKSREMNICEKDLFKLYAESISWSKEQLYAGQSFIPSWLC